MALRSITIALDRTSRHCAALHSGCCIANPAKAGMERSAMTAYYFSTETTVDTNPRHRVGYSELSFGKIAEIIDLSNGTCPGKLFKQV